MGRACGNALDRFAKEFRVYAWEREGLIYDAGARAETRSLAQDASWGILQWQVEANPATQDAVKRTTLKYEPSIFGITGEAEIG